MHRDTVVGVWCLADCDLIFLKYIDDFLVFSFSLIIRGFGACLLVNGACLSFFIVFIIICMRYTYFIMCSVAVRFFACLQCCFPLPFGSTLFDSLVFYVVVSSFRLYLVNLLLLLFLVVPSAINSIMLSLIRE